MLTLTLEQLQREMAQFIADHPTNTVQEPVIPQIYSAPIAAVAAASDALFHRFQEPSVIGPHHTFPDFWVSGAQSVISYFLPFSETVRAANRKSGLPALEWVYGRYEGEQVNNDLRQFVADRLQQAGWDATAPMLDDRFEVIEYRSNWSERHVAFAAGLGTFGLHTSFITEKGSAGRFGSIVTTAELPVTTRRHDDIYANCSFCRQCIPRCPVKAISDQAKDHRVCSEYQRSTKERHFKPRYGCGKCQTGVACEERIPV